MAVLMLVILMLVILNTDYADLCIGIVFLIVLYG